MRETTYKKRLSQVAYFLLGVFLVGLSVAIPLVSGLFLGYGGFGLVVVSFLLSVVILPVLVVPWLTNEPFQDIAQKSECDVKAVRFAYRYYVTGAALLVSFALLMALSFSPLGFVSPLVQLSAVIGAKAAIGIIATSASLMFLTAIPIVLASVGALPSLSQIAAFFVRRSNEHASNSDLGPSAEKESSGSLKRTPGGAGAGSSALVKVKAYARSPAAQQGAAAALVPPGKGGKKSDYNDPGTSSLTTSAGTR